MFVLQVLVVSDIYKFCTLSLWLYNPLDFGCFFSFWILHTIGRIPWTGDQPIARPLPTHKTQLQNKRTQTYIPRVGFEPTIPMFERAKSVHDLDEAATLMGTNFAWIIFRYDSRDYEAPCEAKRPSARKTSQLVMVPEGLLPIPCPQNSKRATLMILLDC
jgi:hypothetical protein